ncbi:hypothetical protein FH5_04606 [Priestia endophytica]|nr:hypothetical protein FH5_04606 [Priestia endophytica]
MTPLKMFYTLFTLILMQVNSYLSKLKVTNATSHILGWFDERERNGWKT